MRLGLAAAAGLSIRASMYALYITASAVTDSALTQERQSFLESARGVVRLEHGADDGHSLAMLQRWYAQRSSLTSLAA